MDKELLKLMLARLARWAAVALVAQAVTRGWLTAGEAGQATAELAQLLLEAILVLAAALAAGWLAIQEKLRRDAERARLALERERVEAALTLPPNATREQLEMARLSRQQMRADAAAVGGMGDDF